MPFARALVLILTLVVYGWNFWTPSIYMLDEAKNAGCAAEMFRSGDWVTPLFNGSFHDKPALQYYFMGLAYWAFGVNAFSARIFSILFGVLTVLVTFHFTERLLNKQTAVITSLMLIGSLQMSFQFRMAVPDPYLLFFLTSAFFCFFTGLKDRNRGFIRLFYLCIGLGFVSKGPIAVVLPGLSIVLFLLTTRNFTASTLRFLLIPEGISLFALTGLTWYVWVGIRTNWEWPVYFFFTHNVDRYLHTFEGHGGFLLDTVLIIVAALLPLSTFLPQALARAWRHRLRHPLLVLCLSIACTFVVFFLFSKTLLPSYPAPAVPFVAIIIAHFLSIVCQLPVSKKTHTSLIASAAVLVMLCAALPVAAFIALRSDAMLSDLAYHAVFFIPLCIGAGIGFALVIAKRIAAAVYSSTGGFMIALMLIYSFTYPAIDKRNPVAKSIGWLKQSGVPLISYQQINSAYIFNLQRTISVIESSKELDQFALENPRFLIISTMRAWESFPAKNDYKVIFECKDLFESPTTIVLARATDATKYHEALR